MRGEIIMSKKLVDGAVTENNGWNVYAQDGTLYAQDTDDCDDIRKVTEKDGWYVDEDGNITASVA